MGCTKIIIDHIIIEYQSKTSERNLTFLSHRKEVVIY